MSDTFTSLIMSVIVVAMVSVLVTRKGVPDVFTKFGAYLAAAIKTVLGTN
jgi:Flp pilus assembly pilin Flp